jgi:hypothetical protein
MLLPFILLPRLTGEEEKGMTGLFHSQGPALPQVNNSRGASSSLLPHCRHYACTGIASRLLALANIWVARRKLMVTG